MAKLPNYGIDAPIAFRNTAAAGLLCWVATIAVFLTYRSSNPSLAQSVLTQGVVTGAIFIAVAGVMIWSSKVGKFLVRDRLLDSIAWRGDERVLDIGCGRGLALIGAAKRLSTGTAIGIDVWSQVDLSGNAARATWDNARAEGVIKKIDIETADARNLPFGDGTFDVVLSMTALHNIKDNAGRRRAIAEAVRVLKPGGRVALFDIFSAGHYGSWLVEDGIQNVAVSRLLLLWMVPGRTLTGQRSASASKIAS